MIKQHGHQLQPEQDQGFLELLDYDMLYIARELQFRDLLIKLNSDSKCCAFPFFPSAPLGGVSSE